MQAGSDAMELMDLMAEPSFCVCSGRITKVNAAAAALLLEWIIYQLSVPVVEALEVKSLMILGTQQKEGIEYPSREWGYGTLDLFNVFEQVRRF